jgi:hypothetical protein
MKGFFTGHEKERSGLHPYTLPLLGKIHNDATGVCKTMMVVWTECGMGKINRTLSSTYI